MTEQPARASAVANFALVFIRKFRVTILLFLVIVAAGFFTYTNLLKREGFPAINVPVVLIQGGYFVNDPAKVDAALTTPIEQALKDLPSIQAINSTTTDNLVFVSVEVAAAEELAQTLEDIRDHINREVDLPEQAELEYRTFNAGTLDGEHEMIVAVSGVHPVAVNQAKAKELADRLSTLAGVVKAEALDVVTTEINPLTGEPFQFQRSFNRVGLKENDKLLFYPAIGVGIKAKPGTGTLDLSDAVRKEVEAMRQAGDLDGLQVSYGGDLATDLRRQLSSLSENAVTGLIVIMFVVFLFINWRAGIVMALFLPLTLAATFIALYLIGYSLNTISLFALILVLGLFVDDGTVVVEAIDYYKKRGLKGLQAIKAAVTDIGAADIAGTMTTLLVFVPMLFISGVLGDFIVLIPVTVILALGLSLIFALSFIPYVSSLVIRDRKDAAHDDQHTFLIRLGQRIAKFVGGYLHRPWLSALVVVTSLALIVVGGAFAGKLKFSVFPSAKDTNSIDIQLSFPTDYTLAQAENDAKRVETIASETIGSEITSVAYFDGNQNGAFMQLNLTPLDERKITSRELVAELQPKLTNFGATRVKVQQTSVGPTVGDFPFAARIFSDDPAVLARAAEDLKGFLTNRTITGDDRVSDVRPADLRSISKVDGRRFVDVSAKISDPTNTGLILQLQEIVEREYTSEKLTALGLASDALAFDFGQESENLESFTSAIYALGAAMLVMYLLLLIQFNSFTQPLLIFLAIPFTVPGLFPGLYFTDNVLSFFVMLGVIALAGIVVNNTILLVEYANHATREGKNRQAAIQQALATRFRAMIATTATTIGGLIPLALSDPFWESLALTIIFGLLSSLILVVFAFPVYFVMFEKARTVKHKFFAWVR